MGNVLHVILGPETELFADIHGAKIVDVSDVLSQLEADKATYLSYTRCKSEPLTAEKLKNAGISFKSSFSAGQSCPHCAARVNTEESAEKSDEDGAAVMPKKNVGVCQFCQRETELLDIPKFKICVVCAQIEIGRTAGELPVEDTNTDGQA
jgi:hypothetical protein